MFLSDFDLRQIDDEYLESLNSREILELSKRLIKDLKIAIDRLNQNPSNSSRPPSSSEPWVNIMPLKIHTEKLEFSFVSNYNI